MLLVVRCGFPDATIVAAPFGIYVADKVHKIQVVFLANCRDATTARHALTRLVEWLDSTGEETNLVSRARGRRCVVAAINCVCSILARLAPIFE